jgi:hypothetical protein
VIHFLYIQLGALPKRNATKPAMQFARLAVGLIKDRCCGNQCPTNADTQPDERRASLTGSRRKPLDFHSMKMLAPHRRPIRQSFLRLLHSLGLRADVARSAIH